MTITSPSVSVAKSATHLEKHSLNSSVSINAKTSPKVSCEGTPFSSLNSSVNQRSFASPNSSMATQLSAPHITLPTYFPVGVVEKHQMDVGTLSCRTNLEPVLTTLHSHILFFHSFIDASPSAPLAGSFLHCWRLARHPRYISPWDIHVQRFIPLGRLIECPSTSCVQFQLRTKAATLKLTSLT
jgi:hypothetical protein